jgi:hypothetical protein
MSNENVNFRDDLKACNTCGKAGQFDFCSKDCLEKYKEHQEEKRIEAPNKIALKDNPLSDDLKDGAFQKGIHWRKNKLEAIYRSRKAGISDEQILRELTWRNNDTKSQRVDARL